MKEKLQALLALKLNAQTFSEDADEEKKDTTTSVIVENQTKEQPKQEQQQQPPGEKKFTQEDLTRIATKESKQAQSATLKKLGFESIEDAQEALTKYQSYMDAQKTDEQKRQEQYEAMQKQNTQLSDKLSNLEAERAALLVDVKPDSMNDVITLARSKVNDEVSIEDAIKQVVTQYPQFGKSKVESGTKPIISAGEHKMPAVSEQEVWNNAFKMK